MRYRTLACIVIGILLLAGCDTDIEVDYAGRRRIAEGDWDIRLPLLFGGDRRMLVADGDGALHILPFEDGSAPCEVGSPRNAVAYWTVDGVRIGLRNNDSEDTDTLRFIDGNCEETLAPLGGVVQTVFMGNQILAHTANGDLHALNPWQGTAKRIARGVLERGPTARGAKGEAAGLWLLEGERLIARDLDGKQLYDAADGVTRIETAHRNDDRFAYIDEEGVHVLSTDGSRDDVVHEAGCRLRMHVSPALSSVRRLTMLSPCDEGRLIAIEHRVRPRDEPPTLDVTEVATGVVNWWHRGVATLAGTGTWTAYVTEEPAEDPADAPVQRTFLARPDGEAREMGVALSRGSPLWPWLGEADWSDAHGRWLARTDGGQLGLWSDEDGWQPVAEWVDTVALALVNTDGLGRLHAGWVALHDFDGEVSTLSRLDDDETLSVIAEDVPREGLIDLSPEGTPAGSIALQPPLLDAVIHDSEGGSGTLSLIAPTLQPLAEGVLPGEIRLFEIELRGDDIVAEAEPEPALAYLGDVAADERFGTLSVQLLDGRAFEIDRDVSSFRPSNDFVRPGIAYTVARGPRKGLWFAAQ